MSLQLPNIKSLVKLYPYSVACASNPLPKMAGSLLPMTMPCQLQQILSKNLRYLNTDENGETRYTGKAAEAKTKMAAKTFSNMLTGRHISRVDSIEKAARLFGVQPWELFRPDFIESRGDRDTYAELSRAIHDAGPDAAKALILRALMEAGRSDAVGAISEYIASMPGAES